MGGWSSGKKNWAGLNTHEMRCANGRKESEERRKKYDERLVWMGLPRIPTEIAREFDVAQHH